MDIADWLMPEGDWFDGVRGKLRMIASLSLLLSIRRASGC